MILEKTHNSIVLCLTVKLLKQVSKENTTTRLLMIYNTNIQFNSYSHLKFIYITILFLYLLIDFSLKTWLHVNLFWLKVMTFIHEFKCISQPRMCCICRGPPSKSLNSFKYWKTYLRGKGCRVLEKWVLEPNDLYFSRVHEFLIVEHYLF